MVNYLERTHEKLNWCDFQWNIKPIKMLFLFYGQTINIYSGLLCLINNWNINLLVLIYFMVKMYIL